jgi:hypothetical protein
MGDVEVHALRSVDLDLSFPNYGLLVTPLDSGVEK